MLVIDDCQGIVGYDEAVACSKTAWHPLGKVQPLFDHDHRVLAGCFGCGQAFHDELRVFISAFRHLLIKVRESLRRIFQFLPQRRLHLEFAERMGIRSLAGEFTGGIRQLGTFLRRRRAGQPTITGDADSTACLSGMANHLHFLQKCFVLRRINAGQLVRPVLLDETADF